jgi:hypothetical protein
MFFAYYLQCWLISKVSASLRRWLAEIRFSAEKTGEVLLDFTTCWFPPSCFQFPVSSKYKNHGSGMDA